MGRKGNLIMLGMVVLLVAAPLVIVRPKTGPGGEAVEMFTGADGQAQDAIAEVSPGYKPWAIPLMRPPSGEVESMLFALQAAVGAGFIGYYFGSRRAKSGSDVKA
ncbi:energy-coupling factor ABC transporter substrate-binding protein [Holophaga foetida]|uniref:energy-coupling factor ABC transporter substrate-binding protein n=1 Tax=Holophaga foetida TaxID=35839 RepID=UPI0002471CEA